MAALTGPRDTSERRGDFVSLPVAAATTIWQGSLVARDGSGYAVPGAATAGLLGIGRAAITVKNSGAAGDERCEIARGIFRFANSTGTGALGAADIGATCYMADDQTVSKTGTAVAGKVFDVDAQGVWVDMRF